MIEIKSRKTCKFFEKRKDAEACVTALEEAVQILEDAYS